MSRMRSPTLFGHFQTLFGVGTLSGLGEGASWSNSSHTGTKRPLRKSCHATARWCWVLFRRWLDEEQDVEEHFRRCF